MAILDKSALLAEQASEWPDNTSGLITPEKLRVVVADLTESCWNLLDTEFAILEDAFIRWGEDSSINANDTVGIKFGAGGSTKMTLTPSGLLTLSGNLSFTGGNRGMDLKNGDVTSVFDFDLSELSTASGQYRFFRNTNTAGGVNLLVYNGNGTSNLQTNLSGKGDSYLNALAGNVGIGVTTPLAKLHVNGDIFLTRGTGGIYGHNSGSKRSGVAFGNVGTENDLVLYAGNNIEFLRIKDTGKVGIGVDAPSATLHVAKNGAWPAATNLDGAQLLVSGISPNTNRRIGIGYDTTNNFGWIQAAEPGVGYTNLCLNPAGSNVGIGTTTPNFRLHVNTGSNAAVSLIQAENWSTGDAVEARIRLVAGTAVAQLQQFGSGHATTPNRLQIVAPTDTFFYQAGQHRMTISSGGTGKVGIGIATVLADLHILSANNVNGGIRLESSTSNAVDKVGRIKSGHYLNAEEPFTILLAQSQVATNRIDIGGGSSVENAATRIAFFTASNNTTTTGTERMRITDSGAEIFGGAKLQSLSFISPDGFGGWNNTNLRIVNQSGSGMELWTLSSDAAQVTISEGDGSVTMGVPAPNGFITPTDILLSVGGKIRTNPPTGDGNNFGEWKLGRYTATSVSATGKVRIEIGGVAYYLLAATV